LVQNWTASTIFFTRTAFPVNGLIFTYDGREVRPDLVPGQPLYRYGAGYPGGKTFNIDAFAIPGTGVAQGNLGRNALRGFGAWQADLALHRDFQLSEHTSVQFRIEAFNAFNHPNFAPQAVAIFAGDLSGNLSRSSLAAGLSPLGTLGELSQLFQLGGSRTMQLALRFTF
jgi:hypothetical protein